MEPEEPHLASPLQGEEQEIHISVPSPLQGEGQGEVLPTSVPEALGWLAAVRPNAVLALLREPDFALIGVRAFAGFRANAQGYAIPLVKSRLAQEAVKDSAFADKLRALAETPPRPNSDRPPTPNSGGAGEDTSLAPPELGAGEQPAIDFQAKLRAERDGWRREREELRRGLSQAEADRAEAEHARTQAEAERQEAKSLAERQGQRLARMERQIAKMHSTETGLLAALRQDKVSSPRSGSGRSGSAPSPLPAPAASLWEEAAKHLLDKGKYDLALSLAEDVLRAAAEDAGALEMASRAAEGKKDIKLAADFARRHFAASLARQAFTTAGETLLRLLTLLPSPANAEREAKAWLLALRDADEATREAARLQLIRLRGVAPDAHSWLTGYIQTYASSSLTLALIPPPGMLGPDDPLPLVLGVVGLAPTARQLCQAVETGNAVLVDAARAALGELEQAGPHDYRRTRAALEQASGDDPSLLIPLLREPKNAAVVDGSNVAYHGQELMAAARPRLRPLLAMRRTLRMRGFFPVVIYGDAPLPHLIDDVAALRVMLNRGEILLTDAGVTADEVALREAKRLGAVLVTNDYMSDWDPRGEVRKIRYTISMTGEALLLE